MKRCTSSALAALSAGLLLLPGFAGPARAAAPDGTVEWSGISHYSWQDRRPLCPVGGEAFQVRFQSWQNDLTAARVPSDEASPLSASLTSVPCPALRRS